MSFPKLPEPTSLWQRASARIFGQATLWAGCYQELPLFSEGGATPMEAEGATGLCAAFWERHFDAIQQHIREGFHSLRDGHFYPFAPFHTNAQHNAACFVPTLLWWQPRDFARVA